MSLNRLLENQIKLIKPERKAIDFLRKETEIFVEELRKALLKDKVRAEVFVGGSFAKNTLVKKKNYDVDILVRFDWKYDDISDILLLSLKKVCKKLDLKLEKVHGSRDYFKAHMKKKDFYFELIPVTKIKKVHEERNVTDLSYFHVPYVKKKAKGLTDEIILAKTFCRAQGVYGAESYIKGFSGYALECLIIYYKSFIKMLCELIKVKDGERLVIDVEKYYKKKNEIFLEMNESKLKSPIILVDPTYKERNALASLSKKTFKKFQKSAKNFLTKPSKEFFIEKEISVGDLRKKAKKNKADLLHLKIKTDRQAGDIAGTKLKKFEYFFIEELDNYFKVYESEFSYGGEQKADIYFILKSRKEIVRIGPPLKMKKHVRAFKEEHKETYEKNKLMHTRIKIDFSAKEFVQKWIKKNKDKMKEMSIMELKIL